jgi:exopolysaccharide biosynthesis polyprenyl glycosylphosphotransferase
VTRNSHSSDPFARNLDFACILLAFAAASGIASFFAKLGLFYWPNVPGQSIKGWPTDYVILLIASLVTWAVVASYTGVHKSDRIESARYSYWRLIRTLALWLCSTGVAIFFLKLQIVSRQFNISFFILAGSLVLLRQFTEHAPILKTKRYGTQRRAIIIGPKSVAEWLFHVLSSKTDWYGSVTHADLDFVKGIIAGEEREAIKDAHEVPAEIFILPGSADQTIIEEWALRLLKKGRTVHVIPAMIDAQLFRQNLGDIAGVPTLTLETGNPSNSQAAVKRLFDLIVSAVLLLLLSPVMGILALMIKLASPGPILFTQKRLGKRGLPFKIFKFRTMRPDAEELLKRDAQLYARYLENNFKLPEDEDVRVTKLGRLLRSTSLDELPQLVNVLRGEMSLVGPRPIVPDELEKYGDYAPLLLMTKPGLTGNWQANGRSRIVEYSERVKLDMEYVRDQSLAADLRIIVQTVGAVARMDGAH